MTSKRGDKVWVLADNTWQWANYEFRITNGEPLGQHSVFLDSGGGRRVLCSCKVLILEKP